jgi:DNA-binding LytR/AlgR family response regulator
VSFVTIHLEKAVWEVVDPADVYLLEAEGDNTRVRLRGKRELVDVRPLDEVAEAFARHGFVRVHREFMVNLSRVRQVRRREGGRDWEVPMQSPVNRVIPVSREAWETMKKALGEGD